MPRNPLSNAPPAARALELVCHPGTPCSAVRRLQANASLLPAGMLSLQFTVTGKLEELALPDIEPPARRDRLWEHTCCEAFLAVPGVESYLELNLAPSTAWATYAFQRYRELGESPENLAPRIIVHSSPGQWTLHAQLRLPDPLAGKALRLGLSAVIEHKDGTLSYWALTHPAECPDFHHPQTFALELTPDGCHEDRP